jgi:hypothetical protein
MRPSSCGHAFPAHVADEDATHLRRRQAEPPIQPLQPRNQPPRPRDDQEVDREDAKEQPEHQVLGNPQPQATDTDQRKDELHQHCHGNDIADAEACPDQQVMQMVAIGPKRRLAKPDAPQHDADGVHQGQREHP